MAATLSGTFTSAPDTPSPIYPDRLIRPLPKRPIRSRLSPKTADSILYPPAPPASSLFYASYASNNTDITTDAKVYIPRNRYGYDQSAEDEPHIYEDGVDSEEDGPVVVRRGLRVERASRSPSDYGKHPAPASKASPSSLDGYDAFENTNNKKKRKIPTSGSLGCHSSLSATILSMGPSSPNGNNGETLEEGMPSGSFYGFNAPASSMSPGFSGAGRGRLSSRNGARSSHTRTPLSTWSGNQARPNHRETQEYLVFPRNADQGIISSAIAKAQAFPPSSPGSISLLDEAEYAERMQFTFTCESDSAKGMTPWPAPEYHYPPVMRGSVPPATAGPSSGQRRFSTQGTQTSPSMTSQTNQKSQAAPAPAAASAAAPPPPQHPNQAAAQPPAQPKKPRRSARSIYAFAARQRRIQQQYTNLHHPPNLEDIWICEFCEYESIFGHPPDALIRQYEIKDRKERRRLAEKRRLLEKAKMKGRKGKKAAKGTAKGAGSQQPPYQQNYDPQTGSEYPAEDHRSQEDDYVPAGEAAEYDGHTCLPPPPQSDPSKRPPATHSHGHSSSHLHCGYGGGGLGHAG